MVFEFTKGYFKMKNKYKYKGKDKGKDKGTEKEGLSETLDHDNNSLNIINNYYQRLNDAAVTASKLKDTINMCLSANIHAHKSLTVAVQRELEELDFQALFLHNNNSFNVMMCVGETLDMFSDIDQKENDLFADIVTRYFEMGMYEVLVESQMKTHLCSFLLDNKTNRTFEVKDKLEATLINFVNILTTISQGCTFLGSMINSTKFAEEEVKKEAIKAVTNFTLKCKELEDQK